ncbi:MAG: M14 family zinc carboxypeptidase [Candidatus Zixiibacteriota bacterium]
MTGNRKVLLFIIFTILLSANIAVSADKYIQAQIIFETPDQMLLIKGLHLDIVWRGDHSVDIITDTDEIAELRTLGLKVDVVHDDVTEFYRSRFADKEYTGFLSLSSIESELMFMKYLYPDLITDKISIGTTFEGRNIYAVKISDNPDVDEDEPEVLFTGAIHAREGITPLVNLNFMLYLLENYGTDPEATYLIDNREMWFIPVVNPDGYAYNDWNTPGGGGMWRKNRFNNGNGTYGVDINRNYGYMWGYDNEGSSPYPDDADYRGTGPFSELETQAMRDFISAHEFVVTLYYHSYSNLLLWPWSYDYGLYTPDENIFYALGEKIKSVNGYTPGPGWILYTTNGDSDDWGYGEQTLKNKNIAITIEIGGYDDGFWPETSRLPELQAENLPFQLYLANAVGNIAGVMAPESPLLTVPDSVDVSTSFEVNWFEGDTNNPAVKYELCEMTSLSKVTDIATDFGNWTNNGFTTVTYYYHSSNRSFWSNNPSTTERYMQTVTPYIVKPNDTLKFWAMYEIQEYFDFAYVEISTDGVHFTPIDGNLSTDIDPWWHNRGHGITGLSGDAYWPGEWVQGLYPLTDYEGQDVYVRFSYKDNSLYYAWNGIYIDDIYPVMHFETINVLSNNITDTSYAIGGKTEDFYYYKVRAMDADNQWGAYSDMQRVVVGNPPEFLCGDANGDWYVTVSDAVFLMRHIMFKEPAPDFLEQGDVDACGSINVSDVVYMMDMFLSGGPGPCEYTGDCVLPMGNNNVSLGCPRTVASPAVDDTITVPVYITNDVAIAGFTLGFHYNSADIEVVSVNFSGSVAMQTPTVQIDTAANSVFLGFAEVYYPIAAQSGGLLGNLMVKIPAGISEQTIDFDSVFIAPAGEFIFSALDGGTIYPGYTDCGTADINIINYMCGDANSSLSLNILDVTFLISYLYKGGPIPNPPEAGDANGNGSTNILDVTYLITYLYKGGPAPVCP